MERAMLSTGGKNVLALADPSKSFEYSFIPYFVSAFAADKNLWYAHGINVVFGVVDVLAHVAVWIIALIYESNVLRLASDMKSATPVANTQTYPYAYASFVTLLVPFCIVFVSSLFSLMSPITPKTYLPFLTSIMEGGLMASLLFTAVCALFSVGVTAATEEFRDFTVICITFKALAMSFLNANLRRAYDMP